MNTKQLFDRAITVEREILALQEDLKELKSEFTYHQDHNTQGLDKEEVGKVLKAAKAAAKQDDIEAKIEELTYINTFIGENS
jgi:regulator of replication initiation timing